MPPTFLVVWTVISLLQEEEVLADRHECTLVIGRFCSRLVGSRHGDAETVRGCL